MRGEYRCGVAQIRTAEEVFVFRVTTVVSCGAATMLHVPCTHPQEPAPQSSGPSQLIVHITPSQAGFATRLIQLAGWQHWAGTQSESALQPIAFIGVGAVCTIVSCTVAGGAASGAGEVHPATARAAQQRRVRQSVCISIPEDRCMTN